MKSIFCIILIYFFICGKSYSQAIVPSKSATTFDIIWEKEYRGDGSIVKDIRPYDYQLYPRNNRNIGSVSMAGTLIGTSVLKIKVIKVDIKGDSSLVYISNATLFNKRFRISIPIVPELCEYSFSYSFDNIIWKPIAEHVVCGDVYIISGQSNAFTNDLDSTEVDYLLTTYGPESYFGRYSRTYGDIKKHRGPWHVSSISPYYQPVSFSVGTWGLILQHNISKRFRIPTCIINGAVGGTNIDMHMPPDKGPYFFQDSMTNNNHYFRHLNTRVYEAGLEKDIKGIFWFQGDGGQDGTFPHEYINRFSGIYAYWQQFFPYFKCSYIIQIHSYSLNNPNLAYKSEDQRIFPTIFQNCQVMASNSMGPHRKGPEHNIHFQAVSYIELARRLENLIAKDFYNTSSPDCEAPDIRYAYKHNDTITIQFNQEISDTLSDDLVDVIKAIRFDREPVEIYSPLVNGDCFEFTVSDTSVKKISYLGILPGSDPDFKCYLKNKNNIGVLTFNDFPLSSVPKNIDLPKDTNEFQVYPNPADNFFRIHMKSKSPQTLRMYNSASQLVLSSKFIYDCEIDCRNFGAGIYSFMIINQLPPFNIIASKIIIIH